MTGNNKPCEQCPCCHACELSHASVQAPHAGGFQQRTLADIILQKIQDKERAQGQASTSGYASTSVFTALY